MSPQRLAGLIAVAVAGCTSPFAGAGVGTCFDVVVDANSAGTNALFRARRCQGGGVTWGAILAQAHPGLSYDDEGDAVRVCGAQAAVDAVRQTYARLNSAPAALQQAMNATSAFFMECTEADGSPPRLPEPFAAPIEGR